LYQTRARQESQLESGIQGHFAGLARGVATGQRECGLGLHTHAISVGWPTPDRIHSVRAGRNTTPLDANMTPTIVLNVVGLTPSVAACT
jgi:hypothetical protein